jgi:NAD(P)H-flavin reductase
MRLKEASAHPRRERRARRTIAEVKRVGKAETRPVWPLEESLSEDEILAHAERIATGRPMRGADEVRPRRRCVIEAIEGEGSAALRVRFSIDEGLARSLREPAQYTTIGTDVLSPRYIVIADVPDEAARSWEVLVSRESSLGRELGVMSVGDEVWVSEAEGPGFDVSRLGDGPLLCFVAGTGIAAARPVLEGFWRRGQRDVLSRVVIYYGAPRWDAFAYEAELSRWIGAGSAVWRSTEQEPDGSVPELRYVHQVFMTHRHDLSDATALLCGGPAMLREVSATLMRGGLDVSRVLTNI